jgi:hypothetical protein
VGSRLELHLDALPTTITTVTGRPEAVKLFAWAKPAGRGGHKELLREALDHGVRREGDTVTICEYRGVHRSDFNCRSFFLCLSPQGPL